jgi:hypothetical protein
VPETWLSSCLLIMVKSFGSFMVPSLLMAEDFDSS